MASQQAHQIHRGFALNFPLRRVAVPRGILYRTLMGALERFAAHLRLGLLGMRSHTPSHLFQWREADQEHGECKKKGDHP